MTNTQTNLKTSLSDFGTSLSELKADERNDLQIEQNHYGDYLMIKEPKQWSKKHNYRVWLNHPENVKQGEPKWVIEYAGIENGYSWKTIAQGNE